ncbi:hypothetical protein [Xanthomonas arboricola]|uniref:hypothetical protein n=1 Tax=Xanthomonas arboricola TaxID=56448 RepID=UPI0012906A32|nr:hypothetical protein [Xanthomonas arboricola]
MSDIYGHDRQDPSVSVEQLHSYLQSKQWFEDGKIRNVATIWHTLGDKNAEVVLPIPTVKDYQQRIRDALIDIASFEQRSIAKVVGEVKRLFSNVITIRVVHEDTRDGTIPINDGVLLVSKAKELLSAAAQAVYSKRRHFSGRTPKIAREYLDTLLLGQTEIGSYVVNVILPQQQNGGPDQSRSDPSVANAIDLSQAITSKLVMGLDALAIASLSYEEQGKLKVFDAAVASGASANLCDALLGFSGERYNREFEITVAPAPSPLFNSPPRNFSFDGKRVEVLQQASGYYKDDYWLQNRILIGHITTLVRRKGETSGTITLDATLGEVERKIRVTLTGDDYHLAVIAHDKRHLVKVQGNVHVKSKTAELLEPTNFGVVGTDDLL